MDRRYNGGNHVAAHAESLPRARIIRPVSYTHLSSPSTPTRTGRSEASALVTRNSSTMTYASGVSPVRTESNSGQARAGERLARVTAYWAGEGDYYLSLIHI